MLEILTNRLLSKEDLGEEDAGAACDELLDETISLEVRAAFLRALHWKGETPAEIALFVRAFLGRAIRPDLGKGLLDVCGTGGDKAGLFNVSTAVMFVAAACGARVVKHGNRGVTSRCGGADVLEALGVDIVGPPEAALDTSGCCFLFAPKYHPAFRAVAPVRRKLAEEGVSTIFNILGPLLNPAEPEFQLAGVFDRRLLPIYAETFALLGRTRAWAVHGAGGLDEVSTLGRTEVRALENGRQEEFLILPEELGLTPPSLDSLRGGNVRENARLLEELLEGAAPGPRRDIVVLNSACALMISGLARDFREALPMAGAALADGRARAVLEKLRRAAPKQS